MSIEEQKAQKVYFCPLGNVCLATLILLPQNSPLYVSVPYSTVTYYLGLV